MTSATISFNSIFSGATLGASLGATSFEIHTLEWFFQHNRNRMTRLKTYEIIWIRSGCGHLTADHVDIELAPGKVYLLRPGQFRHLQSSQWIEGYYLSMVPDFFHLSGPDSVMPLHAGCHVVEGAMVLETDEEIRVEAEDMLVKMRREFNHHGNSRSGILKCLFRIFMLYLSQKMERQNSFGSTGAEKDLVNRFMDSLKKHFASRKMVADYAHEFCVTPGHLNRIVKKISGFPVSHHIQQQIVLEAKRLARFSDRSMKEIAYALGFEDLAHFSKFFKNNSGMNFSNFKKLSADM
jgi:AraC-like DNA-binding protein